MTPLDRHLLRAQARGVRAHMLERVRSTWWLPATLAATAALSMWLVLDSYHRIEDGTAYSELLAWAVVVVNLFNVAGCLRHAYMELQLWYVGLTAPQQVEQYLRNLDELQK